MSEELTQEEILSALLRGMCISEQQLDDAVKRLEKQESLERNADGIYAMLHAAGMSDAQICKHRLETGI